MESAQKFFERYLSEKAGLQCLLHKTNKSFYKKYFTNDLFKDFADFWMQREANPEIFEGIENGEQTARAFTSGRIKDRLIRHRSNLGVSDGKWKVSEKETECFVCDGSGRQNDQECHFCEGKGWKNYV